MPYRLQVKHGTKWVDAGYYNTLESAKSSARYQNYQRGGHGQPMRIVRKGTHHTDPSVGHEHYSKR